MKKLNKIVLVQWYLLPAIEILVRGNVAIIGPNGTGKSSILDAMQIVLMGANKNKMTLNPGAGEKSHRTIREYCLGIVDDPNISVAIRPREQATTYLALGFVDEITGEETCAGIAFSAALNDPEEYLEGRFIVPGLSVSLNDFVRETPAGRQTIPWSEVKQNWNRHFSEKVLYPTQAGRFTKELFAELSEDKGYPNDDEGIIKNLRNAIVFAPITDTTEFVRKFILEDDESLRLGDLRHALKNYRDMSKKAEDVANRIEDLTKTEGMCDGVSKTLKALTLFSWAARAARVEHLLEMREPEQESLDALEEAFKKMIAAEEVLDGELKNNIGEHAKKEAELNNSEPQLRRKSLEMKKEKAENDVRAVLNSIAGTKRMLRSLPDNQTVLDMAPAPLMKAITQINLLTGSDGGMLEVFWPSKPVEVDTAITQLHNTITAALPQLEKHKGILEMKLIGLTRENDELKKRAEMLRVGKAISEDTEKLSKLLQSHDIESTPICDLVDVSDERWRKAIESILGMHREALLVEPEKVKDAYGFYRREGKQFNKGQRVVDTLKTDRWKNKITEGSLAELVTTDDPHARAYINRHLGNIIRVETEQELIKHERSATADMMLYSGGSVTATRPVDSILGRQSKERLLEQIEEDLRDKTFQCKKSADDLKAIADLLKPLVRAQETAETDTVSLVDLVKSREECQATLKTIVQEIADLTVHEDKGLKSAIAELEKKIKQGEDRQKKMSPIKEEKQKVIAGKKNSLEQMEILLTQFSRERDGFKTNIHFSVPDSADLMEKLREKFDWNYDAIISHAETEANNNHLRVGRMEERARSAFREHWIRYAQSGSEDEIKIINEGTFIELVHSVLQLKKNLEDTCLAEYREKASKALYEAEVAFRAKFVVNLNTRLAKVKAMITDLNRHLKKRPFHDEIYQFKWKNNPEFEKILSYIESIDAVAQAYVGGLFDLANDPSSPHREAIEEIAEALKDESRSNRLEDYKNYLVFDFTMQGKDDGAVKTSLKQRIQKGSGGENQAPFYVAIGASLASAYRIGSTSTGDGRGGISLAIFDEAFNKLDLENCHNCLSFLKDIHLQVILAAPDEKYGIMSENMDTVVRIFRDKGDVDIEIEYPTEEGKRLLRSDNPYCIDDAVPLIPEKTADVVQVSYE
jgi:DNA repair exonuclease SbcCD ATPase subunit